MTADLFDFFPITVTDFYFRNILLSEEWIGGKQCNEVMYMRCGNRRRRRDPGKMPCILAVIAFLIALICLVAFSAKCILLFVAVTLIALGIFLLRL